MVTAHADADHPHPEKPRAGSGADPVAPPSQNSADPRLLTPTFVLSWLVNFVQFLMFYLLVTTVALYAVKEFAASEAASGFAASSFVVGATVARIFVGYLVDVLGQRRTMLAAILIVTIACALYLGADTLPLLIIVRLIHGSGYAFATTALMAIAQTAIPSRRRAEGTGYFALGSTLATAVGPALGLFLVESFTYDILFWVTLGTAVLGLILALFLRKPAAQLQAETDSGRRGKPRPRFSLRDIAHPAVVPIGSFMMFVGLCYAGVITYLNAYAEQRGLVTGAGLFFLAYAATMLVMRFILGRMQDRHGDNVVVYLGLVSFALALGLLAMASADWQVIVAGALTGLGYGTLMPACQAIAVSSVPPDKLGTGISTMFLFMDVGLGLGPIALGVLVTAAGYGTMYAVLAAVAVFAAVYYFAVHGRHDVAKRGRAAL